MHWRLLASISLIRFLVFGFILKSLMHFELSFVHVDRYGSMFILPHLSIQSCQHYLSEMLFSPLYNFCFFDKNELLIGVCISIWVPDLISVVNVSVCMPIPSCCHDCSFVMDVDGVWCLRKFLFYIGLFLLFMVFNFSILSSWLFFKWPWWIVLVFLCEMLWIYRMLLVRLTFLLC